MQVAAIALGFVIPLMFVLGGIFALLWGSAYLLGRKIERERAEAFAAFDEAAEPPAEPVRGLTPRRPAPRSSSSSVTPPKPSTSPVSARRAAVVRQQVDLEAGPARGRPAPAARRRWGSSQVEYIPASGPASSAYGVSAAATRGARSA